MLKNRGLATISHHPSIDAPFTVDVESDDGKMWASFCCGTAGAARVLRDAIRDHADGLRRVNDFKRHSVGYVDPTIAHLIQEAKPDGTMAPGAGNPNRTAAQIVKTAHEALKSAISAAHYRFEMETGLLLKKIEVDINTHYSTGVADKTVLCHVGIETDAHELLLAKGPGRTT